MLLVVLVLLHALVAILWLAYSVRLQLQVRLVADPGLPTSLAETGGRTVQIMSVLAIVFYALAVGAFFYGGGFAVYGPVFHTSLLLGLVLVLVQVLVVQPAWARFAGGDAASRKRVAMGLGVGHAVWLLLFVLMFFGPRWLGQWAA